MISVCLKYRIKHLLSLSWSQRLIARTIGVSRGTVRRIAQQQDADHFHNFLKEKPPGPKITVKNVVSLSEAVGSGQLQRCKTCGALVTLPCRACAIRQRLMQIKHNSSINSQRHEEATETLLPALLPADQQRYEQIRAVRLQTASSTVSKPLVLGDYS